jgi:hypothetical protein
LARGKPLAVTRACLIPVTLVQILILLRRAGNPDVAEIGVCRIPEL